MLINKLVNANNKIQNVKILHLLKNNKFKINTLYYNFNI